jgi:hypothetical protein
MLELGNHCAISPHGILVALSNARRIITIEQPAENETCLTSGCDSFAYAAFLEFAIALPVSDGSSNLRVQYNKYFGLAHHLLLQSRK